MASEITRAARLRSAAKDASYGEARRSAEGAEVAESAGSTPGPHPLTADEQALVAAVLQKDRKAAAEFVSRYADPVYAYVSRRLAPRADLVEDVVQDVFLAALQKLDTFAGQSSVGQRTIALRVELGDAYDRDVPHSAERPVATRRRHRWPSGQRQRPRGAIDQA